MAVTDGIGKIFVNSEATSDSSVGRRINGISAPARWRRRAADQVTFVAASAAAQNTSVRHCGSTARAAKAAAPASPVNSGIIAVPSLRCWRVAMAQA
jgi:hypothetical protein